MKIIAKGNEWEKEITCDYREEEYTCGGTFIFNFEDLTKEETTDRSESLYMTSKLFYHFYVICPNCGNKIRIKNLPKKLFSHY